MDHIYAKVKKTRGDQVRRVVSDVRLFDFEAPSPDSCIEYAASVLLDEDEWFKLDNFSARSFFPNFLKEPFV